MQKNMKRAYKELLEKLYSLPLSQTLPLALRLARDLKDASFERWIRLELDGYSNDNPAFAEKTVVPEYRWVTGQHKNINGQPFLVDPKLSFMNRYPLRNGVGELEELVKSNEMIAFQDVGMIKAIQEWLKVDVYSFEFSKISVVGILNTIKSKLADQIYEIEKANPDISDEGDKILTKDNKSRSQVSIQMARGAAIAGNIVVANSIQKSFNKIDAANVSNELKTLLKQLAEEVGKISQSLPKEAGEQAERDLEVITAEATSNNARKEWLQLAAEGLTRAAKAAGRIGKPILELLPTILAIVKELKRP